MASSIAVINDTQYTLLATFMERIGYLSTISTDTGCLEEWRRLADVLNRAGESHNVDTWRQVWNDLQENTHQKWVKLKKLRPVERTDFTSWEIQVLDLMCIRFLPDSTSVEDTLSQGDIENCLETPVEVDLFSENTELLEVHSVCNEDMNMAESSNPASDVTPIFCRDHDYAETGRSREDHEDRNLTGSSHQAPEVESPEAPRPQMLRRRKRQRLRVLDYLFMREIRAREEAKERYRRFVSLERERMRQNEITLRQREGELVLRAQALQFMTAGLKVLGRCLDKS